MSSVFRKKNSICPVCTKNPRRICLNGQSGSYVPDLPSHRLAGSRHLCPDPLQQQPNSNLNQYPDHATNTCAWIMQAGPRQACPGPGMGAHAHTCTRPPAGAPDGRNAYTCVRRPATWSARIHVCLCGNTEGLALSGSDRISAATMHKRMRAYTRTHKAKGQRAHVRLRLHVYAMHLRARSHARRMEETPSLCPAAMRRRARIRVSIEGTAPPPGPKVLLCRPLLCGARKARYFRR